MLTIPRVALYARFSSNNQREESIDAQVRAMTAYCNQQHWQIVAKYVDEAKSATTDNRPEFQRMISDSSKDLFNIILVHKLDRFARNRYDSVIYKSKLKKNNVTIASVLERIDDSPESIILESMLEGMSEYYSRNLAREVAKGLHETALQCRHTGGNTPLGYVLDSERRMIIEPHEAEAVRLIFTMYDSGFGYDKIIEKLNLLGYKTKKSQNFGKNSIHDILLNEKYTGVYIYNRAAGRDSRRKRNNHLSKAYDEIVRIEGGCPQIISRELFERVRKRMDSNKYSAGKYYSKQFYLLSGKLICGTCGKRMAGSSRLSGQSHTRFCSYSCGTPKKLCINKELNKNFIEPYIIELLQECIFNPKSLRKLVTSINRYIRRYNTTFDDMHEDVSARLDEINANLENITRAIESGLMTESLIQRAEELEREKTDVTYRLTSMRHFTEIDYNSYSYLIEKFKELDHNSEEFRTLIQSFIREIKVFPYDVEVNLDVGLGVTDEMTETVRVRRGELFEMWKKRGKNNV